VSESLDEDPSELDKISVSIIETAGSDNLSGGDKRFLKFITFGGLNCLQSCKSIGKEPGNFSTCSFNCSGDKFSPIKTLIFEGKTSKSSE